MKLEITDSLFILIIKLLPNWNIIIILSFHLLCIINRKLRQSFKQLLLLVKPRKWKLLQVERRYSGWKFKIRMNLALVLPFRSKEKRMWKDERKMSDTGSIENENKSIQIWKKNHIRPKANMILFVLSPVSYIKNILRWFQNINLIFFLLYTIFFKPSFTGIWNI